MPMQKSQMGAWLKGLLALFVLYIIYALLTPNYTMPLEARYRSSCQSNLKQLGLAFAQYEQENDQKTPPGVNVAGNGWAGQIYPFVKANQEYHCPADKQDGSYISYTANQNAARKPLSQFAEPHATVQLYEATTLNCDPSVAETVSGIGISAPQDSKRHNDEDFGLNFLAMDGHVRYLRPEQVSSGPGALATRKITRSPNGPALMTFAIK